MSSNHSKNATEQYFPVVLFIMLYKVVLTIESVDEGILTLSHRMKSAETTPQSGKKMEECITKQRKV